jgi:hypothetical protein
MEATAPVVYSFKDKRLGRDDFCINMDRVTKTIELFDNIADVLLRQLGEIQCIGDECSGIARGSVGKAIYAAGGETEKFAKEVKKLGQVIDNILQLYENAERTIQHSL